MKDRNKEIEKIADEISFRLLATRNHADYEWLYSKLETTIHPIKSALRTYWNLFFKNK